MTFLTEAWFWRGTQSAIFYYLSFAPCTKVADQRKKKREAKRAKAEREMAGTFQHPLPSGTNPYWNEEITLGPGPPPKRAAKEKAKKEVRTLKSSEAEGRGSRAGESSAGTGSTSLDTSDGQAIPQDFGQMSSEEWNRRRYQREDEILWGLETVEAENSIGVSTASRSARGAGNYNYARNPEVNELHPPVVSTQPTSKRETQWMLQPPPRAKVMEGKERDSRSRSNSGTSASNSLTSRGSSRRGGGENLGRAIGEKSLEGKKARGEAPSPAPFSSAVSRNESHRSTGSSTASASTITPGQRHDRDRNPTRSSKDSLRPPSAQQDRSNPPSSTSFSDPFASVSHRPPLSTIPSTSTTIPQSQPPKHRPQHILVPLDSTSSLQTLQKLTPPAACENENSDSESALPLDRPTIVQLSPRTKQESNELTASRDSDGWRPRGEWEFPMPTGNPQTGHRWSMDL